MAVTVTCRPTEIALRTGVIALVLGGAGGLATLGLWLFADHMQIGAITGDWPWLYRAGQAIWAHGLPQHALWSWTFPNRPWVLYQWLFEAAAAPIYGALGLSASVIGVSLLGVAMYAVLPALYLQRRGVHPLWTCVLGALVLLPVSTNLGLRPMLASNLALLAQFVVVQRLRSHRLSTAIAATAIALIYVLWANSHLGFTLGLLSLLLFAIGDAWTRWRTSGTEGRRLGLYAGLGGLAVLASGLNPYGWTVYPYIIHLSLESQMNAHIHELMAPDPHNLYMRAGAGLFAVFVLFFLIYRRVLSAAEVLHVAVFCALAISAMRFIVWAGLFYALVAPKLLQHAGQHLAPRLVRNALTPLGTRATGRICLAAFVVLACTVAAIGAPWTAGSARLADCPALGAALVRFNRNYPPDTHWFSSEIGGSCAHAYTPKRGVFIDTRFDMYPQSFVMDWFRAYQYRQNWRGLFKHWRIRVVLLPRGAPLAPVLKADPAYRLVYRDPQAVIYTRGSWPAKTGRDSSKTPN